MITVLEYLNFIKQDIIANGKLYENNNSNIYIELYFGDYAQNYGIISNYGFDINAILLNMQYIKCDTKKLKCYMYRNKLLNIYENMQKEVIMIETKSDFITNNQCIFYKMERKLSMESIPLVNEFHDVNESTNIIYYNERNDVTVIHVIEKNCEYVKINIHNNNIEFVIKLVLFILG
jgi:hypothetical protein